MKKYYMLFQEKGKLPSLLLNSDKEEEEGKSDRVVYWTNEKKAKKQLKLQKERYRDIRYSLLAEV